MSQLQILELVLSISEISFQLWHWLVSEREFTPFQPTLADWEWRPACRRNALSSCICRLPGPHIWGCSCTSINIDRSLLMSQRCNSNSMRGFKHAWRQHIPFQKPFYYNKVEDLPCVHDSFNLLESGLFFAYNESSGADVGSHTRCTHRMHKWAIECLPLWPSCTSTDS